MAYNQPGVRINQEVVAGVLPDADPELASCVIGPLYEIFAETDAGSFDPLSGTNQTFTWPGLPIGSVVDLQGTKSGFIDSQRKFYAVYPVGFQLKDAATGVKTSILDSDMTAISQSGFTVDGAADNATLRASLNLAVVEVNNEKFLYKPGGGLTVLQNGDLFTDSGNFSIDLITDIKVTIDDDASPYLTSSALTADNTALELWPGTSGVVDTSAEILDATSTAVSGRTRFSYSVGGPFSGGSKPAVGDIALSGTPIVDFGAFSGVIDATTTEVTVTGGQFTRDIQTSEVLSYVCRIQNTDTGFTYFRKIVSIDTTNDAIVFDLTVGLVAEAVTMRIYKTQLGYVETVGTGDLYIDVVTPEVVTEVDTFVWVVPTTLQAFSPRFTVLSTYRTLRVDLANSAIIVSNTTDFETEFGGDITGSTGKFTELGWAANVLLSAQPEEKTAYFIPVDLYGGAGAPSGLPEDWDKTTGYTDALVSAESLEVYNMVDMDQTLSIQSLVRSHVDTMSTEVENKFRRGFFIQDIPVGETESLTGILKAGRTIDGLAATGGNKVLEDLGSNGATPANFVTNGGVVAGTVVVVTSPSDFAGTYTALGSTTDNELHLAGVDWTVANEFVNDDHAAITIVSTSGSHVFTGYTAGDFTHVEVGDYAEVGLGAGTLYRLKVTVVGSTGFTAVDEVAGVLALDVAASATVKLRFIRTWGPDNGGGVQYHIRPLSRANRITAAIANKSLDDRRYTVMADHDPYMKTGTDSSGNDIKETLDPIYSLVAVAAKRSGLLSYEECTNLFLNAGIETVKHGFNAFSESQLNSLGEAGFTLVTQKSKTGLAFIRDMITSKTGAGLEETEELVIANADWQSLSLKTSFGASPGAKLPTLNPRLIGIRTMQIDAILRKWAEEGRLSDYTITDVSINTTNKRQLDVAYVGVFPLAEKEIEFTMQITV